MCSESIQLKSMKTKNCSHGSLPRKDFIHVVQMSDTFAKLSIKYDVTVSALQKYNNFRQGDQLWSRRQLRIPLDKDFSGQPEIEDSSPVDHTATPSPSHLDDSLVADTNIEAPGISYDKAVVRSDDCVAFLANFDRDFAARKEATSPGEAASPPTAPVVESKSALDFLSQFDRMYAKTKSKTEQGLNMSTKLNKTSLIQSQESDNADDICTMLAVRGEKRLVQGTMQTYSGKLQAKDRALNQIQRILTSDFEVVNEQEARMPSVPESRQVCENVLDRDLELFDL